MTWNYRVCRSIYKDDGYDEVSFAIHEVYYNPDGSIWATSQNASPIFSENLEGVKDVLEKMRVASEKEVIDLDTLVYVDQHPGDVDEEIDIEDL